MDVALQTVDPTAPARGAWSRLEPPGALGKEWKAPSGPPTGRGEMVGDCGGLDEENVPKVMFPINASGVPCPFKKEHPIYGKN